MKFTTIVSPDHLARQLRDPQWVVFDCRFSLTRPQSGRQAYAKAHIPGAHYAHLEEDLSGTVTPASGRHPLPDPGLLVRKLGLWGVDTDKQIVVYDDSFGSMAARMWWLLHWLGHNAVALLDGGLQSWIRQGRELTADIPPMRPAELHAAPDHSLWIGSDGVLEALQHERVIIDARPEERFSGFIEPLDKVAGHVPGALNSPFEDNLDLRGNFLSAEQLRAHYKSLLHGARSGEVIHMCGSGVTACHNLLAMEIAGMPGGKLYPGSWSEWITDPSRPIFERRTS